MAAASVRRCVMTRSLVLIAALAAGGGVLLHGQTRQSPPPGDPQEPVASFRSSVEAVQISVIVTDREGKPAAGLTEADFEVFENRVPRPIVTFAEVNIPVERTAGVRVESDVLGNDGPPGRLYVIALDQMSTDSILRARFIMRRFIENHFGPNDTAAVVLTTSGPGDSGQEFTGNPRRLLAAIDRFGGGDLQGEWTREKNFVGDLRTLLAFMATLRGARKSLILVTEGVPVDAYDVIDARPARFGGIFSEVNPEFVEALSFATRNNIAIYPINPRGLTTELAAPGSFDTSALENRTVLGGLAAVTGGFALTGSNNFDRAFERLVLENSSYYQLAFDSGIERRDGRYVPIEVRVKRPGLQVRSMDGYIAPRGGPQQPRRPTTVLASVWDAVASAITTSGVSMRVNAAPFRNDKGKDATVAVTLEIASEKLNLVEQDGAWRGVLEILLATTDSRNKRRWPIWRHRAALALKPDTYERVSRSAIRVISQLPLPEGRYQLRVSAGGEAVAGSVIYDMEVPDFRDDFSLSGITLTSSQAQQTLTFSPHRVEVSFPGPPTTAREFSPDDTLTLFAEAYENRKKPHTVTFAIELRDEDGLEIGRHVMERTATDKPKQAGAYAFAPNLKLEEVPPGRYVVHVEARSSLDQNKKNKSVRREIPFSVR
jgi:VWFA-related protein